MSTTSAITHRSIADMEMLVRGYLRSSAPPEAPKIDPDVEKSLCGCIYSH